MRRAAGHGAFAHGDIPFAGRLEKPPCALRLVRVDTCHRLPVFVGHPRNGGRYVQNQVLSARHHNVDGVSVGDIGGGHAVPEHGDDKVVRPGNAADEGVVNNGAVRAGQIDGGGKLIADIGGIAGGPALALAQRDPDLAPDIQLAAGGDAARILHEGDGRTNGRIHAGIRCEDRRAVRRRADIQAAVVAVVGSMNAQIDSLIK